MILSLLLACNDAPEEVPFNTFADVHQPQLTINAGNLVSKGWRLQVLVHPELEGVCRALPELQARLDGAPLTRLHGIYDDGTIKYDRDCFVYEFEASPETIAAAASKPDSVITVSDGVTTLGATVHHLFAEPRFEAPAAPVAAGTEVLLTLLPAGDVVDATVTVSVELTPEGGAPVSVPGRATPEGVRFTPPAGVVGSMKAEVFGTLAYTPTVSACVQAAKCSASRVFVAPPVAVTVN